MNCAVAGDKHLSSFFGSTKDLSPEERGKHLENDTVRSNDTLHFSHQYLKCGRSNEILQVSKSVCRIYIAH